MGAELGVAKVGARIEGEFIIEGEEDVPVTMSEGGAGAGVDGVVGGGRVQVVVRST